MGPEGEILAKGPYGPDAETLVTVTVQARRRRVKGTQYGQFLREKGYAGP